MASTRAAEICQADRILEKSAILPLIVDDSSHNTYQRELIEKAFEKWLLWRGKSSRRLVVNNCQMCTQVAALPAPTPVQFVWTKRSVGSLLILYRADRLMFYCRRVGTARCKVREVRRAGSSLDWKEV